MSPVHVLDPYYLAITALVTIAYQLSGFAIAFTFKFDKITDFTGGSNFFILALFTLLMGNEYHTRNIVVSIFVMVWAVRIAAFLLYRVLKTGSDSRFDEIRSHFLKFLGFWIGQIVWVWTVSLPVTILNSPAVSDTSHRGSNPAFNTSRDIGGIVLWSIGFLIETVADIQKFRFKQNKSSPKDSPMMTGLWKYSRHPPYFGEMLCWWGVFMISLSPATNGTLPTSAHAALYGSIVSPIFTVLLLMFASGVPTAEKPQAERYYVKTFEPESQSPHAWTNYMVYRNRTSILVPMPPSLYAVLPRWLKQTILLDFPFYSFSESKDGPAALAKKLGLS